MISIAQPRGKKPIPTNIKKLKGNPGKRALPKNEPKPERPDGVPAPPKYLDKVAKQEWRRIAPELYRLGLLTNIDITALAGYCALFSRWQECESKIKKEGMVFVTDKRNAIHHPYAAIASKSLDQMKAFLTEFGMTPSSRTRISVSPPKKKDPMEAFLRRVK